MKGKKMETWAKTLKRFGHWAKGWRDWAIGRFVTKKIGPNLRMLHVWSHCFKLGGKSKNKIDTPSWCKCVKDGDGVRKRVREPTLTREHEERVRVWESVCVWRERERERERQHVIKTVTLLRIRGCIQMEIREFQQINQPSFRFKTSNKVLIV